MKKQQLNKIMLKAAGMCASSGARFTDKRKKILELLVTASTPLSAYELADAYNLQSDNKMPTMSVYRILDFLESEQLVHKLSSTNKFVACSHIACDHSHEIPQFLICNNCQQVKEIAISNTIIEQIDQQVQHAGYALTNPQIELHCLCGDCQ